MYRKLRINQDPQMLLKSDVRAFLVYAGQATITSNIGCENGGEPSHKLFAGQNYPPADAWSGYAGRPKIAVLCRGAPALL